MCQGRDLGTCVPGRRRYGKGSETVWGRRQVVRVVSAETSSVTDQRTQLHSCDGPLQTERPEGHIGVQRGRDVREIPSESSQYDTSGESRGCTESSQATELTSWCFTGERRLPGVQYRRLNRGGYSKFLVRQKWTSLAVECVLPSTKRSRGVTPEVK